MSNIDLAESQLQALPVYTQAEVFDAATKYFRGDALAASSWTGKYALKHKRNEGAEAWDFAEKTPDDMHWRLANELARADAAYANNYMADVYYQAFKNFNYLVPQGSPMYGIGNPFVNVSISNCVVVEQPADNISSIFETGKDLANLFKRRCGVGVDISSLRPDGASVNNSAGTSTGAWSFADFYSFVCRMIGQNGRRGALMLSMDVRHPDIARFIVMKRDTTKVTGANVSVMLTDKFMQAVDAQLGWVTCWPIDTDTEAVFAHGGKWQEVPAGADGPLAYKRWLADDGKAKEVIRTFDAAELWYLINESAVTCAEPGLLFWDNYGRNLPANFYPEFKSVCVNPCAEISLSPYDSCRLTSLNLKNFVVNAFTPDAYFDYVKFDEQVRLGMRVMDNIVDLEIEYLSKIIDSCKEAEEKTLWGKLRRAADRGRRTGLGTHGLADALACLNLRYDSDAALIEVDRIFEMLQNSSYDESVNLAIERGPFPAFDWEIEKECAFIQRLPQWLQDKIEKHGRRNISLLTMAPTGTVSIVSQTSSGVEPVFSNYYMRRKKVNPSDQNVRVDFVDGSGDSWEHFEVVHHNVTDFLATNELARQEWENIRLTQNPDKWAELLTAILPPAFITSAEIDPMRRVEIQGVIQKHIDHGISSTINMPKGTTVETGQELYMAAWKHGLKGVTIYVDGSRSGVLVNVEEKADSNLIRETHSPKRPDELECDIHHVNVQSSGKPQKWTVFVGLLAGKPYEVFAGKSEQVNIKRGISKGMIVKSKSAKANAKGRLSRYDLVVCDEDGSECQRIEDVVSTFDDAEYAWGNRMISLSLRHGVPVHFVAEQLGRDKDSEFFAFDRVMARVLKKYVADGVSAGEKCECGEKYIFESGCFICKSCGASPKCG